MAGTVKLLDKVAFVRKDGAGGVKDVKDDPVVVPRGAPKVARRYASELDASKVALKYRGESTAQQYDRKGRKLRDRDPLLAYYVENKKRSR